MAGRLGMWAVALTAAVALGGAGEVDTRLSQAFLAAFGTTGPEFMTEDGTLLHFTPGGLIESPFGLVLLSPATAEMPSPLTFGALGVHYLAKTGAGLRLTSSWPDTIGGGTMGNPPDWQIDDTLTRWPVVIAKTLEGNQGIFSEYTQLVELSPQGPHVLVVFRSSFSDGSGDTGGAPAQDIQGRIVNVVRDQSFEVEFTGTAQFRQTFARRGDSYEMTGSTGTLPDL